VVLLASIGHRSGRTAAAGGAVAPARLMSTSSPSPHARCGCSSAPSPMRSPGGDGRETPCATRDDAVRLLARALRRAAKDVLVDVLDPDALVLGRILDGHADEREGAPLVLLHERPRHKRSARYACAPG